MKCRVCNNPDTQVKDSRVCADGNVVRRRRQCISCGYRFTTNEKIRNKNVTVIKCNGATENFDLNKLTKSINIAVSKRGVSYEDIEEMTDSILHDIENTGENKILFRVGVIVV